MVLLEEAVAVRVMDVVVTGISGSGEKVMVWVVGATVYWATAP